MIEIKHRYTGGTLYRADGAQTVREAMEMAVGEGANLAGANLECVNLEGANLAGAKLRGADLEGAKLWGAKQYEFEVLDQETQQRKNSNGTN